MEIFTFPLIIIYAAFYGITMKVADLMNEHSFRWFKGDAIIFGFLWGIFGALLILGHNVIAQIILAMNLSYILRGSLDYPNHRIATTIILMTFLLGAELDAKLFLIFFIAILIFGVLEDKNILWVNKYLVYYPVLALVYSIIYNEMIVFWAFFVYAFSYSFTKYYAYKKGYK